MVSHNWFSLWPIEWVGVLLEFQIYLVIQVGGKPEIIAIPQKDDMTWKLQFFGYAPSFNIICYFNIKDKYSSHEPSKVKEYDNSLTKSYCITISIQKMRPIHTLWIIYEWINFLLGPFEYTHPKIIESTFSFPEFIPKSKKSVYSICSFLRYRQF